MGMTRNCTLPGSNVWHSVRKCQHCITPPKPQCDQTTASTPPPTILHSSHLPGASLVCLPLPSVSSGCISRLNSERWSYRRVFTFPDVFIVVSHLSSLFPLSLHSHRSVFPVTFILLLLFFLLHSSVNKSHFFFFNFLYLTNPVTVSIISSRPTDSRMCVYTAYIKHL